MRLSHFWYTLKKKFVIWIVTEPGGRAFKASCVPFPNPIPNK